MEAFQNNIIFLELASLLLALMFVKTFKSKYYYFFIAYLIFAITADFIGGLITKGSNAWVFNIYTFFEYSAVAGIYYFLNKNPFSKKVIVSMSTIFYCIYIISFIYIPLQRYTVIILHFFVVPFLFLFLQELLNSNKITNYKKQLFFWITVGLLIYYLGTLPFITLSFIEQLQTKVLYTIPGIILVIMHLIFIMSLIWLRKVRKLS
jgi:hypothetical protein